MYIVFARRKGDEERDDTDEFDICETVMDVFKTLSDYIPRRFTCTIYQMEGVHKVDPQFFLVKPTEEDVPEKKKEKKTKQKKAS